MIKYRKVYKRRLRVYKKAFIRNKTQIIWTILLSIIAIIIVLIPVTLTLMNKENLEEKLTNLFLDYEVESYEDAMWVLDRKGYENSLLYSDDNETVYVWNKTQQKVVNVSQRRITLSKSLTSFDYEGNYTLGYYYGTQESYLLARPESIEKDLKLINESYKDPTQKLEFSSQGVFLQFVEFAYNSTLISTQKGDAFLQYSGGKPYQNQAKNGQKSGDFEGIFVAILTDFDTDLMSKSALNLNVSLLNSSIKGAKEIVIEGGKSLDEGLFFGTENLERFIVHSPAFRLESGALIDNTKQKVLAYPSKRKETTVTLSNDIQEIAEGAFAGANLTEMTLPFVGLQRGSLFPSSALFGTIFGKSNNGVNQLVGNAFVSYGIPLSLTRIVITDETILCKGAFSGMTMVKSIELNYGIEEIQNYAFDRCATLKELKIPSSVKRFEMTRDNGLASLEVLELPQGLNVEYTELMTYVSTENGISRYKK